MAEKWIDVSAHQGMIDWPKVKASGIVGAVIRAGYGGSADQQDAQFTANIRGAHAAGLKEAVYWFHYADSVDEILKEWAVCRQIILLYRQNILFVVSDYEYDSYRYYKKLHGTAPGNDLVNKMVNSFLAAAKADGWSTALYTNNDYRRNVFSAATLAAWPLWLADYTGGPDVPCMLQQTGSTGSVPGIYGSVDMDVRFNNLSAPEWTCDTAGTVEVARGTAYQALITCSSTPSVIAGTPDVVTVLHRSDVGERHYYYFVPIGRPGEEAGIYINGGPKQFIVRVR